MADKTGISWTDATWNPIVGCSVVSPGCTNCYAQSQAARIIRCSAGAGRATHYEGTVQPSKAGPVWTGKVALAPDSIMTQPLRWKRGRRIFVNSMGDPFHESVPGKWIDRVFAIMALAPQHSFRVLTKRVRRMREYMAALSADPDERLAQAVTAMGYDDDAACAVANWVNGWSRWRHAPEDGNPLDGSRVRWPLPNVWMGVTAEDQTRADERIPDLLETPAVVRFVSCEPMLGPVDFSQWLKGCLECSRTCGFRAAASNPPRIERCHACGHQGEIDCEFCPTCGAQDFSVVCPSCDAYMVQYHPDTRSIDWVICGGESGPDARPMHPDWARELRDQCASASVPFFAKQMSGRTRNERESIPDDLIVREFPRTTGGEHG